MDSLYMFALMPHKELALKIDRERRQMAENYNCIKALKPPVHITLFEPFKAASEIEQKLTGLSAWAAKKQPFQIELRNYSFFENPFKPVVYIEVVKNEQLKELHRGFVTQIKKYIPVDTKAKPYTPHITIAYRDLSPVLFPKAKTEYTKRRFSDSFLADSFFLWKHNGDNWQVREEFKFLNSAPVDPNGFQTELFG